MSNPSSDDPVAATVSGITKSDLAAEPPTPRNGGFGSENNHEGKFRQLADALPQIVWITRPDGYHEYYNKHWWDYTGLTYEQARGEGWNILLHPDDRQRSIERWQASLQSGEPYEVEYRFRRASDGMYRWFLGRALPQRDADGNIVRWLGTCTDIHAQKQAETDRKSVEAQLARTAARLQSIIESITDAFFSVDRDWRFTYINEQAARLLQRTKDELLGSNVWEQFPEAVGSQFDREYHRAIATGQPVAFEEFYPPLNTWFDVHAYPSAEGLSVYFHDVTARRQAEEALRISKQRIALVLDSADVGLWYCPLPFGRLEWDHRVKEHFWLAPEAEVTLDTFFERLYPEDREPTRLAIEASIANRTTFDIEYRTTLPNGGEIKWIRAIGRAYYKEDGTPNRFDGITIDATVKKRTETEREELLASERAARTEAERTSRMKDEFLANLSHELRTPLNAILGWSQVLKIGHEDNEDLHDGLSVIERNARVQAQLIEDLLDMSRIISGKLRLDVQPVDLAAVIEAALKSVKPAADAKDIRLQKVLDPLAGPVMGDPARLQQIVWNLLSNALKFTPKMGRVQVFLERVNSHIEIIVSDTGEGIKAEFLPHVFERFRQEDASTTRKHGGLGLGLAIVKNLTEMHGGHVRVKSPGEDQGATFIVHLPLAIVHRKEDAEAREHPKAETSVKVLDTSAVNLAGIKILIVDDEADGRSFVKRLLQECRADVEAAGSAAEGLEVLRRLRPDVLISDVGMPEQDGYQFLKRVRELRPEEGGKVAAIALTAFARSDDRRRAMLAGFDMHVAKPVEPSELIAVVARLAGRV